MSARERVPRRGVPGRTHRSAPTRRGRRSGATGIGVKRRLSRRDGARPLPGGRSRPVCPGRRGAVTPPYGSTTGGAQQPRAIPQSRLRRASSCCGTQNSLFAKRSQNFDHCHSFLLASSATGGARKRPPLHKGAFRTGDADCRVASLLAMTVLNLCHSEEAQRADVGIRPFYDGRGFGPPSRRPLRVVAESRRNHPGSALSAEREAGQIRSLPDDLGVQHGVQGSEV